MCMATIVIKWLNVVLLAITALLLDLHLLTLRSSATPPYRSYNIRVSQAWTSFSFWSLWVSAILTSLAVIVTLWSMFTHPPAWWRWVLWGFAVGNTLSFLLHWWQGDLNIYCSAVSWISWVCVADGWRVWIVRIFIILSLALQAICAFLATTNSSSPGHIGIYELGVGGREHKRARGARRDEEAWGSGSGSSEASSSGDEAVRLRGKRSRKHTQSDVPTPHFHAEAASHHHPRCVPTGNIPASAEYKSDSPAPTADTHMDTSAEGGDGTTASGSHFDQAHEEGDSPVHTQFHLAHEGGQEAEDLEEKIKLTLGGKTN
ncbi:hypothetical protein JCM10207_001984 [Rhodosporidiobolus poonsookiae]